MQPEDGPADRDDLVPQLRIRRERDPDAGRRQLVSERLGVARVCDHTADVREQVLRCHFAFKGSCQRSKQSRRHVRAAVRVQQRQDTAASAVEEMHVRNERGEARTWARADRLGMLLDNEDLIVPPRRPKRGAWLIDQPAVRNRPLAVERSIPHSYERRQLSDLTPEGSARRLIGAWPWKWVLLSVER